MGRRRGQLGRSVARPDGGSEPDRRRGRRRRPTGGLPADRRARRADRGDRRMLGCQRRHLLATPSTPSWPWGHPRDQPRVRAIGSESLTYSLGVDSPPDLFEAFNIGPDEVPTDDPVYRSQLDGVFAPNVWPESLPDARRALVDYFDPTWPRWLAGSRRSSPSPSDWTRTSSPPGPTTRPTPSGLATYGERGRPAARCRGRVRMGAHRLRHRHRALRRPGSGPRDRRPGRGLARCPPG